jgi:hypothetical protein
VAERHDLKRDMQFNTRVTSAEFSEATNLRTVSLGACHFAFPVMGSIAFR